MRSLGISPSAEKEQNHRAGVIHCRRGRLARSSCAGLHSVGHVQCGLSTLPISSFQQPHFAAHSLQMGKPMLKEGLSHL